MVRAIVPRLDLHHPERQRRQGIEYPAALPVFADIPATQQVCFTELAADFLRKHIDSRLAAALPVFALKQDKKIIATDMVDELYA